MKKRILVTSLLICIICLGLFYYLCFPVINYHDPGFWWTLFFIFAILSVIFSFREVFSKKNKFRVSNLPSLSKVFLGGTVFVLVVLIFGSLSGATIFRAKSYANLLKVEERDFSKDIEQTDQIKDIALMDTESARIFGNRKIGSLSQVVSQFEVEEDYNQINYQGSPMKISALKYASFFKWWNNSSSRVPGYVEVNPVNSEAKYVALKKGMKYVPSGYFNDNLYRHVQLKYPTKIISDYYFEIDDSGNPYYVCPTITAKIGLFSGMDVNGVILCNPVDGACKYYKVNDVPKWVDRVYDGNLLTRKYNWHGILSDGFWNSIIGQKGCRETTDDYGYKTIADDVWIYTGVTSVTGDKSNIGFVMMNQRTSEARYYNVSGAEEHSAMDSAEGEVQEKAYKASFPSLINVAGVPTYVMVLKDAAGLVKMYAMVNVEQYNIVATATTQTEVFSKYRKLLATDRAPGEKGETPEPQKANIVIEDIQFINTDDGTVVYIRDQNRKVYKEPFSENEDLIKLAVGDTITVEYEAGENDIHTLLSFAYSETDPNATQEPVEDTTD